MASIGLRSSVPSILSTVQAAHTDMVIGALTSCRNWQGSPLRHVGHMHAASASARPSNVKSPQQSAIIP
jgi:hypothetical protein